MTWKQYFQHHAAEAEQKARDLSGHERAKKEVVAEIFRSLARDCGPRAYP